MSIPLRTSLSRGDVFALGVIATGAVSVAVAALVAIVQGAFATFDSRPTLPMPLTGGDAAALAELPGIERATYTRADVVFTALPTGVRWLLFTEGALPALATIGVCIVAWSLGVSLIRARPFRSAMPTLIAVVACLVIVGGVGGQVAGAIGRAALVEELTAASSDASSMFWTFLLDLDLTPIGWGFALALVAGAFSIGSRLQRDTDGLV